MADMIELHLHIGDKLDSLWQFYISIHLAILSGIFLLPVFFAKRMKRKGAKVLTLLLLFTAYSGFMWVNGGGILKSYEFMHASQTDLRTATCSTPHENLCATLLGSDLKFLRRRAFGILILSWLLVAAGFATVNRMRAPPPDAGAGPRSPPGPP
jgi:hypothetical protein